MRTRAMVVVTALVAVLAGGGGAVRAADGATGGYDDWSCQGGPGRPDPVVLLHGLGGDPSRNWSYMGPALAADGYCVFASPYSAPERWPFYGLGPIEESAEEIAAYVDDVLAATGAERVSLVGHSEGGFLSLYVPKFTGVRDRIGRVVALAPPTHGTTFLGLVTVGRATGTMPYADELMRDGGCAACADLVVGGPAVERLNDGPIAQPGITYTVIATLTDVLVRNEAYWPATDTSFVREPGVTNMYVQDRCPVNLVGHIAMAFDPTVLGLVRQALDPTAPAPPCSVGVPV